MNPYFDLKSHANASVPFVVHSRSLKATHRLAACIARIGPPLCIALSGDLGAGKTAFTQGLAAALKNGEDMRIQSPTFALARSYETTPRLHHLDLYRLTSDEDALVLGLFDLVRDPEAISCVEWISQAPGIAIDVPTLFVHLSVLDLYRRQITLSMSPLLQKRFSTWNKLIRRMGDGFYEFI